MVRKRRRRAAATLTVGAMQWVREAVTRTVVVCLGVGATGATVAATYSESAVKAVYLHRFTAYVQWPALTVDDGPFVIGVLGADEVATELERLLPGLSIQNHRAVVRKIEPGDAIADIQLLYIGPGRLARARKALASGTHRPILVVTDEKDGLQRGAIINFVRVQRTVRFEVSLTSAEQRGLKINSGLLSVAARVEGGPQANIGCPAFLFPNSRHCPPLLARLGATNGHIRSVMAPYWNA